MKKRKYMAVIIYGRKNDNLIISYIDKKYKVYNINDIHGALDFYPEKVRIESAGDPTYLVRFGRLYRRYVDERMTDDRRYIQKKYTRKIHLPAVPDRHVAFFDDLNSAKLWVELQEEGLKVKMGGDCCVTG